MGDPVSKRINVRDFLEKIFDGRERTTKERELCKFSGPRQIWIKALTEFTDVSYESVGVSSQMQQSVWLCESPYIML